VHTDGTEKPEAAVLRVYDALANVRVRILKSAAARIAIIFSQAAQFSVWANLPLKAQGNAVHALTFVGLCGRGKPNARSGCAETGHVALGPS
jgi:hypothetical protein